MKTKWEKWGKAAVLGAMVLAAGMSFAGCGGGSLKAPKEAVKAQTIIDDYKKSTRDADKKYKDQVVRVTGQVVAKGQFNNSTNYAVTIGFDMDDYPRYYKVILSVPSDKAKLVNSVKEDDFVEAIGTCIGTVKQDDPNYISIQIHADSIN